MENITIKNIDLNKNVRNISGERHTHHEAPYTSAGIILDLADVAMRFSRVDRVPRYPDGRRESDVEHSFMLSMVASELADFLYPRKLNPYLVGMYALAHDLIELKTGDVATFLLSDTELHTKKMNEHAVQEEFLNTLPPFMRRLVFDYEAQLDVESRFVCGLDKLLPPSVDILGQGKRVMDEDYDVTTLEDLELSHTAIHTRFAKRFKEFPQLVNDHALLGELFQLEFED